MDEAPSSSRFVVLEHKWNGVHWDFMLETGHRLRTWALDEPPAEGRDIPARALPDHRPAYLDYEGPVSCGRGTVRRVERGVYEVIEWTEDWVRVQVSGAQLVGEVVLYRRVPDSSGSEWRFRLGKVD